MSDAAQAGAAGAAASSPPAHSGRLCFLRSRVASALAKQIEELGLREARLSEHLVKEPRGDVSSSLMAQPDLEDLARWQRLLPGLVLSAADELGTPRASGPPGTRRRWPSASTFRKGFGLLQWWGWCGAP